jgi:homoserine kinase type II
MALLTSLPWADAAELMKEFGFALEAIEPVAAGSVNSNFFVRGKNGEDFFARLYEEQGPAGAEFELRLNELLAEAHIPVARPRRTTAGQLSVTWQKPGGRPLPFSLYERVRGESLCTAQVTPAHVRTLGKALAEVHLAALPGLIVPEGRFGAFDLEKRLDLVLSAGRPELEPDATSLKEKLPELVARRDPNLPRGLIHGDLFRDNVLFEGNRLGALLDFESACSGPFAYDLAVTALAWCYGSDFRDDCLLALFQGYSSARSLSPQEKAALTSEGLFACLRFATTRLTDFSLRTRPGETPARDYRRFLKRLGALENGAFERVLPLF